MRAEILEDEIPYRGLEAAVAVAKRFELIQVEELRQCDPYEFVVVKQTDVMANHVFWRRFFKDLKIGNSQENVSRGQVVPLGRKLRHGFVNGKGVQRTQAAIDFFKCTDYIDFAAVLIFILTNFKQKMETLSTASIAAALEELNDWSFEDHAFEKKFQFADFSQALAFIVRVGLLAEQKNHHPDLQNVYNKVTIRLSTHEAGGVTSKDAELAQSIDRLQ